MTAPAYLIVEMDIRPLRAGATSFFDLVRVEGVDAPVRIQPPQPRDPP